MVDGEVKGDVLEVAMTTEEAVAKSCEQLEVAFLGLCAAEVEKKEGCPAVAETQEMVAGVTETAELGAVIKEVAAAIKDAAKDGLSLGDIPEVLQKCAGSLFRGIMGAQNIPAEFRANPVEAAKALLMPLLEVFKLLMAK